MTGDSRSKGHRFKVTVEKLKGNLKGKCLTQRAVNIWNELSEEMLSDDIITYLKNIWMGIWIRRTYKQIGLMWADGIT